MYMLFNPMGTGHILMDLGLTILGVGLTLLLAVQVPRLTIAFCQIDLCSKSREVGDQVLHVYSLVCFLEYTDIALKFQE